MYSLKITTLADAHLLLEQGWPTKAVSLVCPGTPLPKFGDHHHIVHVNDIPYEMEGMVAPQINHVYEVVAFTADLKPTDRLLVHCFAGVSRSTSMAIAILISQGVPWKEAFDYVGEVRPFMMPNTRIMKMIDDEFGLNGAMMEHLTEWNRKQHGARLTALQKHTVQSQRPTKQSVDWMKQMRDLLG